MNETIFDLNNDFLDALVVKCLVPSVTDTDESIVGVNQLLGAADQLLDKAKNCDSGLGDNSLSKQKESNQNSLTDEDREALSKLSDNLVETIMEKVATRSQRSLLYFEKKEDFASAFDRLVSFDAFGARMSPYILEASRPLTEQEFSELVGAQLIDHSTEIADLPKPARLYLQSALRLSEVNSSPRGAGERWNASGFTPPDSH